MKKSYQNPQTNYADVQLNTIVCLSVGGGQSQGKARAPQRSIYI